ncbi:MAG TPA: protein kinase [Candidatus Binataceae bacterium]|nr:protein kinase [Candidatus Binataceae bacterium]
MKVLGIGEIIGGRYAILKLLGGGGMKRVYLAEDLRLARRRCALAELIDVFSDQAARQQAIRAFEREAEMLARLENDHIPRVYDCFNEGSEHYLVMDYVEGETLEETLASAGGRLGETAVMDIALQILDTLKYLHGLRPQVIYRDLKPSNIMLEPLGHVKLIDFGIARFFQPLKTATMIGTAGYAPPEQYRGKVDQRSDLYALGATMHHALTGRDPSTEAPFTFPPIREIRKDCNEPLAEVIDSALSYESSKRISSAAEFRRRLLACKSTSSGVPTARIERPQTVPPISKTRCSEWLRLLALSVAGMTILFGYAVYSLDHEASNRTPAAGPTDFTPNSTATLVPFSLPSAAAEMSPAIAAATPSTYLAETRPPEEVTKNPPRVLSHTKTIRSHRGFSSKPVELAATHIASINEPLSGSGHFTIGSTKDEVLAIQGTPTSIINGGIVGDTWDYGFSSVDFTSDGKVKGYANISGNLQVAVKTHDGESQNGRSYFTLGSTKDEVLAVQGTPTSIINGGIVGDTWDYGFSSVGFSTDGKVKGYSNISGNLHVQVR